LEVTGLSLDEFVNTDLIARSINPADPSQASLAAGRRALALVKHFTTSRRNFMVETTLSGGWSSALVDNLVAAGYDVSLTYLWLPSAEASWLRVQTRVASGGHPVAENDVRRRFARSVGRWARLANQRSIPWVLVDAMQPDSTIAAFNDTLVVYDHHAWEAVRAASEQSGVTLSVLPPSSDTPPRGLPR
jgi:predicted ABC-type ATPase